MPWVPALRAVDLEVGDWVRRPETQFYRQVLAIRKNLQPNPSDSTVWLSLGKIEPWHLPPLQERHPTWYNVPTTSIGSANALYEVRVDPAPGPEHAIGTPVLELPSGDPA
jgi:hypothetical protein